jgi:hypothetical protein
MYGEIVCLHWIGNACFKGKGPVGFVTNRKRLLWAREKLKSIEKHIRANRGPCIVTYMTRSCISHDMFPIELQKNMHGTGNSVNCAWCLLQGEMKDKVMRKFRKCYQTRNSL